MGKNNFQTEFDYSKLPTCGEDDCRDKSCLYMNNGWGGARYLCPDCAYDLGYINQWGFPTMQGDNANIRDLKINNGV